jgi:hypothetical protein
MDLTETSCEDADWIHMSQDRDDCQNSVNTIPTFWIP